VSTHSLAASDHKNHTIADGQVPKRGDPTRWRLEEHCRKADDLGIATEAEVETMKPNSRIIPAHHAERVAGESPRDRRQIDPEAVDVTFRFAPVLEPCGLCEPDPDKLAQTGREYFARSWDKEDWVSFDDLPKRTRARLWQRIKAGHFNRMLFRPKPGLYARIEGRVAIRASVGSDIPRIVKPADPGSMIYLVTLGTANGD
jgi:hypothetical protein